MTGRVLLIEDDIPRMELMCHLLTTYGYAPLRARNGDEGLGLAARERPDLIVSTLLMPHLDGYEVARRIRADPVLKGTPMIAVSAFDMATERREALAAGFDGYVSEPISPQAFMRHIEAFLRPEFRATVPAANLPPPDAPDARAGGRRVLVVDDTQANLLLTSRILGRAGYQVVTATGISAALRAARLDPPDLIISDIVMSDGSGYEFIRAIKADARLGSTPFIFNTASIAVDTAREKCLALGASNVLFHPIAPGDLLRAVEACLAEPSGA